MAKFGARVEIRPHPLRVVQRESGKAGRKRMRHRMILGLVLGALLGVACHHQGGRAYYGSTYTYQAVAEPPQQTGEVEQRPAPPPPATMTPAAVMPEPPLLPTIASSAAGDEVRGSDGTVGWRVTIAASADEFLRLERRLTENPSCEVEVRPREEMLREMRATCGGVHLFLRVDTGHVYRLCAAGTDVRTCLQLWWKYGQ